MREPVRAYLMAGLSTVAVGAIIAAPMSPVSQQAASPRPQVRTNDVQLAAATTPLTPTKLTDRPETVHVLAEVSRGLESSKAANPVTGGANPLLAAAAPARAELKTGAVTAPGPVTTQAPGTDNRQSSTAPRRAAVNAIDAPGVANVLAQAAQLALDAVIAEPAFLVGNTVFNVDTFLLDVATLDPDTVSQAIPNFIANESDSIQAGFNDLTDDVQGLQDAIGNLFGVNDNVAAVKLAKTTTPAAKAGAAETGATETGTTGSGATDDPAPKKQRGHVVDAGSKGHVVAGKGAQQESTGPAQDTNTADAKDGADKPGKPSGSDAASDTKNPTAKPSTPASKTNASDTKPGGASEAKKPANKADHTPKKANHTGGQSTGNASKSGAKHAKHHG